MDDSICLKVRNPTLKPKCSNNEHTDLNLYKPRVHPDSKAPDK